MVVSGSVEDVSARVLGADVLAIEIVEGLEECIRLLQREGLAPDSRDDIVQVSFEGDRHQASELLSKLTAAGVRIASFAKRRESLEEVFLQVGAKELS